MPDLIFFFLRSMYFIISSSSNLGKEKGLKKNWLPVLLFSFLICYSHLKFGGK